MWRKYICLDSEITFFKRKSNDKFLSLSMFFIVFIKAYFMISLLIFIFKDEIVDKRHYVLLQVIRCLGKKNCEFINYNKDDYCICEQLVFYSTFTSDFFLLCLMMYIGFKNLECCAKKSVSPIEKDEIINRSIDNSLNRSMDLSTELIVI